MSVPAVQPLRPAAATAAAAPAPDWLAALPDRPLVYLTLGTVFNRDLAVFATVLDGLRDEPVSLVVTVGAEQRPGGFGPSTDPAGQFDQAAGACSRRLRWLVLVRSRALPFQ